jgi:hypothetical protein
VFGLERLPEREVDAAADSTADTQPGGDLLAWYTLDALEGGTLIRDASGNGNHATCTSCPTVVMGRQGMAMHFDGTSTIARASSVGLATPTGFTIAMWLEVDAPPTDVRCMTSFVRGVAAADTWKLCLDDGALVFTIDNGLVPMDFGSPAFPQGAWHHVAARWDQMTADILIDGVVKTSMPAPPVIAFDAGLFAIGGDIDNNAAQTVLLGNLDDVKLFSRALSDAEIGVLAQ